MSKKKVVVVKESLATGKKTFMEYPESNIEKYSVLGMIGGFRYRLATLKEVEELQKAKGKTLVEKKPKGEIELYVRIL
jgi:hypothetical protein